jgi:periplasmic divalent cation tolerance protein
VDWESSRQCALGCHRSSNPRFPYTGIELRVHTTIQVITTTETKADAQAIARALVEKRLAGCVQIIGPITSTYWWQGEIETAEEWLCVIKTRVDLYEQLEAAIKKVHPYDVPEILAVPVVAGSEDYLAWLDSELGKG